MTDSFDWDEYKEGDYIEFKNVGDSITGRVLAVSRHTWPDGKVCPKLTVSVNGETKTLTASNFELKKKLTEERPSPGDDIYIAYTGTSPLPGGKTMKHFDVRVKGQQAAADPWGATDTAAAPATTTAEPPF